MTKTTKLTLLAIILLSQVFYIKYLIVPEFRVKPGQVWEYKCTLPFHENDSPKYHTVIDVKDGWVKYTIPAPSLPGGVFTCDCSARIFVADSKLVKDVKP